MDKGAAERNCPAPFSLPPREDANRIAIQAFTLDALTHRRGISAPGLAKENTNLGSPGLGGQTLWLQAELNEVSE